jgi:glycosyltransferase involved in cell wall biosynthesis
MTKLSVLIPVFNEEHTILPLLERVKAAPVSVEKEILVVDDGSTDRTRELLRSVWDDPALKIEFLERNVGRGGVIKHLWTRLTGDIVVHQDADLEYDPNEYERLLEPILQGGADVVYGSRFKGTIERMRGLNSLGNRAMTLMCRLLYGTDISDLMTCYKVYRAALLKGLQVDANGFDFEADFTARLAQRGARFAEVPISFVGRTFAEGKKIRAYDAVRVIRRLVACKFG